MPCKISLMFCSWVQISVLPLFYIKMHSSCIQELINTIAVIIDHPGWTFYVSSFKLCKWYITLLWLLNFSFLWYYFWPLNSLQLFAKGDQKIKKKIPLTFLGENTVVMQWRFNEENKNVEFRVSFNEGVVNLLTIYYILLANIIQQNLNLNTTKMAFIGGENVDSVFSLNQFEMKIYTIVRTLKEKICIIKKKDFLFLYTGLINVKI